MYVNRRRGQSWPYSNAAMCQFPPVRPPWARVPNLPQWLLPRASICGPPDLPLNNNAHRTHPAGCNFQISLPPPIQNNSVGLVRGVIGHRRPSFVRSPRKRIHSGNQAHNRIEKRKRSSSLNSKSSLNPTDPLNLQDLMKETERRRLEGLSPLRGDSRLNTPAVSNAGASSPISPHINGAGSLAKTGVNPASRGALHGVRRNIRRYKRRIPVSGNYPNYYSRRDPYERLQYLMPEWFSGKDVADYGCHNGTMTFMVLERFPDTRRIDAFDCDSELIANARCMQRERIRWETSNSVSYDRIHFQVTNWVDSSTCIDEPEYDTILAFSVTKWIHLNHGDAGLMRFFRRAFNMLKPGGHLILEPQPMSSYRRTRFNATQHTNFKSINIDPSKLESLLVDLGFSYFDAIKIPHPNQPFQRHIMLCSKSYGATPASIRNDSRHEAQRWQSPSPSALSPVSREPPPVNYCPQTPTYALTVSPRQPSSSAPALVTVSTTLHPTATMSRVPGGPTMSSLRSCPMSFLSDSSNQLSTGTDVSSSVVVPISSSSLSEVDCSSPTPADFSQSDVISSSVFNSAQSPSNVPTAGILELVSIDESDKGAEVSSSLPDSTLTE